MSAERNKLIVFVKYPAPGMVKRQLIDSLDSNESVMLHREIIDNIVTAARAFLHIDRTSRSVEIRYSGTDPVSMRSWLGPGLRYAPQGAGDIGERIQHAFTDAFNNGAEYVVTIGTVCPDLTGTIVSDAFSALLTNDVVIGPMTSGGYYLLGINRKARLTVLPSLFKGIAWGTGFVYGDTLSLIKRLGLTYTILETLSEIERPEDVTLWEQTKKLRNHHSYPVISVIIPTVNNDEVIDTLLDSVASGTSIETIVADGGSTDNTVFQAIAHGAHVVESRSGRAAQLNAGIREATGVFLLLLNPETLLPDGYDDTIRTILADPSVACGAFSLRSRTTKGLHRIMNYLAHVRTHILHLPSSDQGLFMRTATIEAIGGVPDYPDIEDITLVQRLKEQGTVVIAPETATSCGSKWSGGNPGRLSLRRFPYLLMHIIRVLTALFRSLIFKNSHTHSLPLTEK